jgi:hypothetical protein
MRFNFVLNVNDRSFNLRCATDALALRLAQARAKTVRRFAKYAVNAIAELTCFACQSFRRRGEGG